ncbi:DUF4350 domain-containing protein [Prauserella oleivorans]|uniref:DUF4350 domain-containing protein n=1 Tax=Prauserella oleivorans TaxID=1478153 RepID=A0ABW5WCZ7_9PSEU
MTTSVSADARAVWRAARTPVVIVVLVLLTGVVLSLARSGGDGRDLDPASAEPGGSRALARLLAAQGVRVEPVTSSADVSAAGATLLVTSPGLVADAALRTLAAEAASVVLIAPDQRALDAVAPGMTAGDVLTTTTRHPGCGRADAVAAGPVTLGGTAYRAPATCYDGALAASDAVTVLGSGHPLTNTALDDEGNAALALRLLGGHERLVWYQPSAGDPGLRGGQESLYDLLPGSWVFGAVQLGVAAALFALWRARRLGPVVTEPLPVVVRGAETVEGRARLYRRAGARDHAAEALRRATRDRLLPALGLPADAEPEAVVAAVAARTGRDAHDVLYGPSPADDAALVRLAGSLDALENEVGQ